MAFLSFSLTESKCETWLTVATLQYDYEVQNINTVHIGYKAGGGTRKNWPYNQYGLISDVTMEGPGEGLEGLI